MYTLTRFIVPDNIAQMIPFKYNPVKCDCQW